MSSDGTKAISYLKYNLSPSINFKDTPLKNSRTWFTTTELASIYNCPSPSTISKTIGVISLGGGLFGNLNPTTGVLTNGDIQKCWTDMGIASSNHPKVIIKTLGGSVNSPTSNSKSINYNASIENTVDITTIGGWYPLSNLTIVMYLANQYTVNNSFYNALNYAINSNVVSGSNTYKPSTISVSWGFTEIFNTSIVSQMSPLLSNAAANGINIFCATGDDGSTSGIPGSNNYTTFPASSPYVIACGGTTLTCPNKIYDSSTVETAWLNGGGGISRIFAKPSYQSNVSLSTTNRCIPDIALNADPNTGVYYIYNNKPILVGGTSIVSPAMSALTAALNINYFLNTRLYLIRSNIFNDITQGNNGGYTTRTGYDLCTGRGSVNGVKLKNGLIIVPTTGITITPSNKSLKVKSSFKFTATVLPENATNEIVVWTSSKPKIVSISASGVCTARSVGKAVITASQGNISRRANVTVKSKLTKTMNIIVNVNEITEINLLTNSEINHVIINNHTDIVESTFDNGLITIKGISAGLAKIIIKDDSGKEYGIVSIKVV
jgi:subtilase family serine protease